MKKRHCAVLKYHLTHLKLNMPSRVTQHVLLSLKILQGASIQAKEPPIPFLVQQPSKPGAWALTVLVQVTTHQQFVAV